MPDQDRPQITLITPPAFDLDVFPDRLARVMDAHDIACLRLALAATDPDTIARAADACRVISHARDVAIVIENHLKFVEPHGLDGIHLTDGARQVRALRKDLGPDAIIGTYCGASRHDGMNAAEAGADYVAFGPAGDSPLGRAEPLDFDIIEWWSQVIEVPCITEGALTPDLISRYAPVTDFFAIGPEIWGADDAAVALGKLLAAL
ncbi:MAG: thiamine phosphate synthase [Cypionkella sp.]|nr:thiamine phosphate synthase [Cypionkella sp.]